MNAKSTTPLSTSTSNLNLLKQVLKAWPVIACATIGLCFLTQTVASWFGITLPEQTNVEIVLRVLRHAFNSARAFYGAAFLVVQVVLLLPVAEELVFRGLLFKLPARWKTTGRLPAIVWALFSSALFSAAHYLAQPWPDNAFLALAFFGLVQCWLYRKTDRIWCPMLNHALFNLTNLVLLFILPQG